MGLKIGYYASQAVPVRAPCFLVFGARGFGFVMISIGLVMVLTATIQHVMTVTKLRAQYVDVPYSLAAVFAFLVSALGILALIDVVIRG